MSILRRAIQALGFRCEEQSGATLVEFAFVLPILTLLIFGVVDVALAVAGNSVGSNASREGARTGIIDFEDADQTTSPNYLKIVAAVQSRLGSLVRDGSVDVSVRCVNGSDLSTTLRCTLAAVSLDNDVIEVSVTWNHLGAAPFGIGSTHTNISRMVILGKPDLGPVSNPALPTLSINDPLGLFEGNSDTLPITFTVTRNQSAGTAAVQWTTKDGFATAPADYIQANGQLEFLDGEVKKSITVNIIGDVVVEEHETFGVRLSNPNGATITKAVGLGTILNDDSPAAAPTLTILEMFDLNTDGKVDRIVATFNKALSPSCNGSAFILSNVPSGGTLQATSIVGNRAELTLAPGSGAQDTSVGSFTVTLPAAPNGICDVDGGKASFAATKPTDRAAPVALGFADTNGPTDGKMEPTDSLSITFSEALSSVPVGATTISMTNNDSNPNSLIIGNVTDGPVSLQSGGYQTQKNKTATYAAQLSLSANGRTITVTIPSGTACSGEGNACSNLGVGGPGDLLYRPSPALRDASTNRAVGSSSGVSTFPSVRVL